MLLLDEEVVLLLELVLLSSLLLLLLEEEEESFLAAAAAAIICFGAFLRCSRRSSVRPPRPILVKKLMANLHMRHVYMKQEIFYQIAPYIW